MESLYGTGFRNIGRQKRPMGNAYTNSTYFEERPDVKAIDSTGFSQDIDSPSCSFYPQSNSRSIYSQPVPIDFDQGNSQLESTPRQLPTQGSRGRISIQSGGTYSRPFPEVISGARQSANIYQQQSQRPTSNFLAHTTQTSNFLSQSSCKYDNAVSDGLGGFDDPAPQTPPSSSRLLQSFSYQPARPISDSSSPPHGMSSPTRNVAIRKNAARQQVAVCRKIPNPFVDDNEESLQQHHTQFSYGAPKPSTSSTHSNSRPNDHTPMSRGIQLVSTSQLPDRCQQVFPYRLFNAIQSKCFEPVYKINDNLVVSAPTGSGKTVILELAICRLVEGFQAGQFKIVYMAPTKSLCAERVRDWRKKFSHLSLNCAELTGDTESSEIRNIGNAAIIVTTPEKWDSVTRKWKDHMKLLQMVKLFLIDEIHMLKDIRGATLEAVVSRMKTIGANVRFIALSATVPNSADIAMWLGKDHNNTDIPARRETFSEDFRPVKLQKFVHGFENKGNAHSFDKYLDGKIGNLILRHTAKKPIMVFCFTRKSCENTAAKLASWWTASKISERAWPAPSEPITVAHKDIQELVKSGVAFHHAGLNQNDRAAIESAYLNGQISVICCTSTLAVGVNLPCHMVVLKNTVGYQDGGQLKEYSDIEMMQMLGRAGRPQFDNTAVAIIMTTNDKTEKYKRLISGQDILESTLHLNLIEHLNSEIGLGTVKNLYTAKRWLAGTFLAVRMRQNSTYYKFEGVAPNIQDVGDRLERVCERDIRLLQDAKLITTDEQFLCTEYGIAMARYMISFETMKMILSVPQYAKISQILHILSQSLEFNSFRMKQNERGVFRNINSCGLLKFPIKNTVSTTADKVSLMIQAQLSGAPMPDDREFNIIRLQFLMEQKSVMERMKRLLMCLIDCKAYDCDGIATRNALELMRSIAAEYWEHSPLQLQQVPNLGPVACRKLIGADISSIEKLMESKSTDIERMMTKNPPYGQTILNKLKDFPRLRLAAELMPWKYPAYKGPVRVNIKASLSLANTKAPFWLRKSTSVTFTAETTSGVLVNFWRGNLRKLEKFVELKFAAELDRPGDRVFCYIACDEIVGTMKSVALQPNVPAAAFPESNDLPSPPSQVPKTITPDEFGSDDIDDQDILALAQKTEISHADKTLEAGFIDIDAFDDPQDDQDENNGDVKQRNYHSVKLPNGKWQCQHACNNGKRVSNKACKHRCCHEGLDKPPKIRPKGPKMPSENKVQDPSQVQKGLDKSKTKNNTEKPVPKFTHHEVDDGDQTDVFNIGDLRSPPKYKDMASREYKRFHNLHTSIQGESDKRLSLKNVYSFASKERPDLSSHLRDIQKVTPRSVALESLLVQGDPFIDEDLPSLPSLTKQGSTHLHNSFGLPDQPNNTKKPASFVASSFAKDSNDELDDLDMDIDMDLLRSFDDTVEKQDFILSDGFESSVVNYNSRVPQSMVPENNDSKNIQLLDNQNHQGGSYDNGLEKQDIQTRTSMKRSVEDSSGSSPTRKVRRVMDEAQLADDNQGEGVYKEEIKDQPEWVKDVDPEFLKFFEGFVEYV